MWSHGLCKVDTDGFPLGVFKPGGRVAPKLPVYQVLWIVVNFQINVRMKTDLL